MTAEPAPAPVLRDRGFLGILASKTSSVIASAMMWVVLPLYVYRVSHSSVLAGIASAANVVPFIVFGMLAGVLVDRASPRRIMIGVELANALVLLSVPLLYAMGALSVGVLCVIGFVSASVYVWFDVASAALIPALVGPARVFQANGYLWSVSTLVTATAAPAGFALLAGFHINGTFAILAIFFVFSATALALVRPVAEPPAAAESAPERRSRRREMLDGFRFIAGEPTIRFLTVVAAGAGISSGAVYGMIVVFANRALGLSTGDYRISSIMATCSVGALVASFVAPRLRRFDPVRVVTGLVIVDTALMVAYAFAPGWITALVVIGAWNLIHTSLIIVTVSARQVVAPMHMQGRVNAAARTLGWGTVPLGSALCGLLMATMTSRDSMLVLVIPLALSGLFAVIVVGRATVVTPVTSEKVVAG